MDVTCELYVDGARFADAPPLGLAPVALDGLSVTWGRESVAEQPDTSTCDFTVRDSGGGTHFRDLMTVGSVVEVFASGLVPQAPGQYGADYVVDGSFEALPAGPPGSRVAVEAGSRVTVTTGGGSGGTKYLRLTSNTYTTSTFAVAIPPDAFSPEVGAWDQLPGAEPGTTQRWSVDVRSGTAAASTVTGTNAATNPNLEAGTLTGWTSGAPTFYPLTLDTTSPLSGSQSALETRTATTLNVTVAHLILTPGALVGFDCAEAVPVYGSIDVRVELATRRIGYTLQWFNAANGVISTGALTFPYTNTVAGQTYRLTFTGTPPAAAVKFRINVYVYTMAGNATVGERVWFDKLRIGGSATDSVYFDGSTPPAGGYAYRWTGTPNASTSERIAAATGGAQVTLQPHIRQPTGATGPNLGPPVVVTVDASWQTVTRDLPIPPGTAPGWVAVRVSITAAMWATTPGTWDTQGATTWNQYTPTVDVDQLRLYPPQTTTRRVLVWSGRISDLTAQPLPDVSGTQVRVLAVDSFADLANRYVGDQPWPAEAMSTRFGRVLTAAAPVGISSVIDTVPGAMRVCSRDVDNQSAGGLLAELATSVDAVLWWACHIGRGGYLWVEDPALRTPLEHLEYVGGIWVIESGPSTNAPDPISLSACDVLADPVQWAQSAEEIATRVDVTWQEAGTPDNTERTYSVVDAPAETSYGVHRYGLSTQLALLADATTVANRVLARAHTVDWRMSGLVWDTTLPVLTDTATVNAAMDLLDGTHRLGLPIAVSDLPEWSPVGTGVGVYCEGGTWEYTGGRWVLSMNVTAAQNTQGAAITWNAAPAGPPPMTWTNTAPAMTWADLTTVGA